MSLRYLKLTRFDVANGPGIRDVLWVSGCSHHCPGCHNPDTWDHSLGKIVDEELVSRILSDLGESFRSGITFSGGDPFFPSNREDIFSLIHLIRHKFPNSSIWVYTGYKIEDLPMSSLGDIDVVVEGPYVDRLRDLTLPYRGSSNQRLVDIQLSIKLGRVKIWNENIRSTDIAQYR